MFYSHSYSMFGPQIWSPFGFGIFGSIFFLVAALWLVFSIVLKGYALWHSAKLGQVWWFIALLIFNTLGILELVYIVFFLKKWPGKSNAKPDTKRETEHHAHEAHQEHHEHHSEHLHDPEHHAAEHDHSHNATV